MKYTWTHINPFSETTLAETDQALLTVPPLKKQPQKQQTEFRENIPSDFANSKRNGFKIGTRYKELKVLLTPPPTKYYQTFEQPSDLAYRVKHKLGPKIGLQIHVDPEKEQKIILSLKRSEL
ncbi:Hypothetical_protein [Hexamita inflata]|uniref:Hypothetical_protein n=1 Tax=Hexamita inflata TaxID=28002 RepID=A0AA86TKV2_9EUKA|nr:Hypothetical protein HINF_LOCUS3573 [Hexamita inflata]